MARNKTWQAAGPRLPGALTRRAVTVLRLMQTPDRTVALLRAGNGRAASLLAAWSADSGGHWDLSPPLPLGGRKLSSASIWPAGTIAIVLDGIQAATITGTGTGGTWRALPALPVGTATLAPGPASGIDALAVHRTRLTIWQLQPGSATWRTTQAIKVPIQFGSSS
jgi:hypothetical protein